MVLLLPEFLPTRAPTHGGSEKIIAPLYAADLVGGCLGSVLAALLLIPLAGIHATTLAMLILAALAAILL